MDLASATVLAAGAGATHFTRMFFLRQQTEVRCTKNYTEGRELRVHVGKNIVQLRPIPTRHCARLRARSPAGTWPTRAAPQPQASWTTALPMRSAQQSATLRGCQRHGALRAVGSLSPKAAADFNPNDHQAAAASALKLRVRLAVFASGSAIDSPARMHV